MSGMGTSAPSDLSAAADLEKKLASTLRQTTQEISRMEGLDDEQRAEVYAILETLTSDTKVHLAMAGMLAGKRGANA